MRIVVTGSDGQLGSDICEYLENRDVTVVPLTINDMDISSEDSVKNTLGSLKNTDMLINTAAFHNPPLCEKYPQKAFLVNAMGSLFLARECGRKDIPIIHFSTDYVFDGSKRDPYTEEDCPNPINIYGNSKLSGELMIKSVTGNYFIIRVSGIFGKNMCIEKGYNFVDKMLLLSESQKVIRVVDDEILTPTFTEDIAAQLFTLISKKGKPGIYHMTAEGSCSWNEFAREIFRIKNREISVETADPGEFSNGVDRPKYSVLENRNLKSQGLNIMPHWKDGLKKFLLNRR